MKITAITANNFIGARAVEVALRKPVALFAGANFAGKSSLQEAVRMALTGETVRVDLKKDYGALITEGAETGFADVQTDAGSFSIVLPAGKGGHSDHPAMQYVLDAQRLTKLSPDERRAFLFGLMGLKTDGPAVKKKLADRGCDAKKIEYIAPILRAGFDAGQKEAQGKAREAKGAWKTTTGGETYGSVKAAAWKSNKPEVDTGALDQARTDLATIEEELERETGRLGEMQGLGRQARERSGRLAELREKAGRYAAIQDKLNKDEAELKQWQETVAETKAKASGPAVEHPLTCPHCAGLVVHRPNMIGGELQPYVKQNPADQEAAARLPEYERALALYERSVANDKRDLAAADAAAVALREIEADTSAAPSDDEVTALQKRIDTIKHGRGNQQAAIRLLEDAAKAALVADERTKKAAEHHQDVQDWEAIADALAPNGIPGEMLAEALGPINARLEQSAADAEWQPVEIDANMAIRVGMTGRHYELLSESEKWRADAMIAEAIGHLSGVKLLVLDRFDVLDLKGREDLIAWLDILASDGEIDTALIFGTLKALPTQLPETFQAFWIDNGVAGQMKQAA